jgi:hypothetical protein
MTYIKWYCTGCNDIIISNSFRHHQMDICKCGKSGCDLEEYGIRWSFCGDIQPKVLKKYEYNFFNEILVCMDKQGFKPFISIDRFYIDFSTVDEVRKIEDEILEGLK